MGVQCKQKAFGRQLTKQLVRDEVAAAEKFQPPLVALTLATTAERDQPIQEFVRKVSDEQVAAGKFRVSVASWGEINDLLNKYLDIARRFYPNLVDPPAASRYLPFPPLGDLFLGRDTRLEALAQDNDPTAIVQHDTIYGLGGIGKTRLAVEFAWRYADQYPGGVFFVSAESPERLRGDFAKLAAPHVLNLPEHQAPQEDIILTAVMRWLNDHDQWLLILDNVDSKESAAGVKELLPRLSRGRVLITSRRSVWPKGIRKQAIGVLDSDDARRYLLNATEERASASDDEARAAVLAERLGYLPLALEQAAAFIERHRLRFEDYEGLWQAEREKVLTWHDESSSYPVAVAVTWQRTFKVLSPGAQTILRIASLLAPDPIPEWVFLDCGEALDAAHESVLEELGAEDESIDPRAALAELAKYSMMGWRDGMLTVHRMVQEVVRSRLRDRRRWVEWALGVVNAVAVGDPTDVRTWTVWDPLRPHVAVIVERGDGEGISEPTSRLMNELGVLLDAKGLYAESEKWKRRALSIDEASFGEDHPNVAIRLNNLANLLVSTNRFTEAEPLMRRALSIAEAAFGDRHSDVASYLNSLAWLLKTTIRLAESEPLMRRALAIDEASFGEDHPKVAIRLNNLATLLWETNRLGEAEPLMQRVVAIFEASFGKRHPNVAIALNNLAALLQDTNRLGEAEPLMHRALTIDEAALGEDHPTVAIRLNNLALLLQDTNRLGEAEPLMRRALSIDEAAFGEDHPNVARDLANLANLELEKDQPGKAEHLMRRAIQIFETSLGPEHPHTLTSQSILTTMLAAKTADT